MDQIVRLNHAMAHIEENLDGEIDFARLGQLACCSSYHFQRMFGYMAGISLSEYIRRRRMSRAAVELQDGGARILDVALKYGYASPTAFNRAFQHVHGFPPSQASSAGATLRSYPPICFQLTIKGAVEMEYRIERRDAIRVVGVSTPLDGDMEKNFQTMPAFWGRAGTDGTIPRLCAKMDNAPMGVLGISACGVDCEQWRYYIAVASSQPADGLEEYTVPACTWAIFPGTGSPRSIQELERRIVTEWLPTSGYEMGTGPDVEVYFDADPADSRYEVWIPVVKQGNTL